MNRKKDIYNTFDFSSVLNIKCRGVPTDSENRLERNSLRCFSKLNFKH